MLHLNDHLYSKPCVFLWVANFRGLTAEFAYLLQFHGLSPLDTPNIPGLSPEGVSIPAYYYRHIFSFSFIQPCDPVGRCPTVPSPANQTLNTVLIITMHSHPFNAMSSCICKVMRHCMLYHATCIMNVTWTMLKPYTSPCTMDNYINQQKISKRSHISCQYICTHIYPHQQVITNQAMTYFIL